MEGGGRHLVWGQGIQGAGGEGRRVGPQVFLVTADGGGRIRRVGNPFWGDQSTSWPEAEVTSKCRFAQALRRASTFFILVLKLARPNLVATGDEKELLGFRADLGRQTSPQPKALRL
jgi:hypothetical protein